MKKFTIILLIAVLAAGSVFGQDRTNRQSREGRQVENWQGRENRSTEGRTTEGRQAENQVRERQNTNRSAQERQARERQVPNRENQRQAETVTVEGTLKLSRGMIALESAGNTFYIPLLTRYIGFINGLREGANVSIEGRSFRNVIHPVKVTIDGRAYDFNMRPRANNNVRPGQGNDRRNVHGRRGCRCGCSPAGNPA
ncbi:MAG: hypothetical protein FWD47_04170 [Treponema sp.]|nr:hypothetical protein [Treponema sp.]